MSGSSNTPPVEGAPTIFLTSGTFYCAAVPTVVSTILDSCVAVCLWDRTCQLGGINHFVLPRRNADAQDARFGDVAIDRLIEGMLRMGCSAEHLRAKLFGGAAVLPCGLSVTVGEQNVRVARQELRAHGISVMAQCTGGRRGLMIRLNTRTGEVLVRRLAASATAVHGLGRRAAAGCGGRDD